MFLPPLWLRCAGARAPDESLPRALLNSGYSNLFNPSYLRGAQGDEHVVFRGWPPGESTPPFHAVYATRPTDGATWQYVDLSTHARGHGVDTVADPKLVQLFGRLYVTFNTGFHPQQNQIYLMRVAPTLGPPQECITPVRRAVEKNWAFIEGRDGLHVVYSLQPFMLLGLRGGRLEDGGTLRFSSHCARAVGHTAAQNGLSIGTQLAPDPRRAGAYLLVAHEKLWFRGRRGYLGRPVTVSGLLSEAPRLRIGPTRLFHSVRALQPGRAQHNPNLLFATYFSGLHLHGRTATLGYGVNDTSFSFAEVDMGRLWP
jgi:hypothetical protein